METWNKISAEVVGMLIRVGMRPMERVNQREIEKEWDEGQEDMEKEINELLLEAARVMEECKVPWGKLERVYKSWEVVPRLEKNRYKIYNYDEVNSFLDLKELNEIRRVIETGFNYGTRYLKLLRQLRELTQRINAKVEGGLDIQRNMSSMEVRDLLKNLMVDLGALRDIGIFIEKNSLYSNLFADSYSVTEFLSYRIRELKDDAKIKKSRLQEEGELKLEQRYEELREKYRGLDFKDRAIANQYNEEYLRIGEAEEVKGTLSEEDFNNWVGGIQFYLDSFGNSREEFNASEGLRFFSFMKKNLIKLILGIHQKEYKFEIKSLFYDASVPNRWNRKSRISPMYEELLHLGVGKDYIFKLIKELEKLGATPETFKEESIFKEYMYDIFDDKQIISKISASEMAKLFMGDLNALQRLMDKDEKIKTRIINYESTHFLIDLRKKKEALANAGDKEGWKVLGKLIQEEIEKCFDFIKDENVKKAIFNFAMNESESLVFIEFWGYFGTKSKFNAYFESKDNFLNFYHENISPINLGLLKSGKLNKFFKLTLNTQYFKLIDFENQSIVNVIKSSGANSDEHLYNVLNRFAKIRRIFHNNDIKDVNEGNEELYSSMLNSKWDLSQDLVNKLINIGLNQKIDQWMLDRADNKKIREIAGYIGLNLDSFRNDLMEIRQILVNGQPIPMSMKDKIYKVDNDLNNLLNGELILKYGDMTEPKRPELFELNYDMGDGLRFQVLPDKSIEHFYVGAATNCCQRAGGAGEDAMIDSFINKNAGVIVLKKGNQIISQSYFHYAESEEGRGYILDNVESNERLVNYYNINLDNLYANLALKIKDKVDYFKCGMDYNKLHKFKKVDMKNDPRVFHPKVDSYTDFSPSKHLDLLNPEFAVRPVAMKKSASGRIRDIMKIAGEFYQMVRGMA